MSVNDVVTVDKKDISVNSTRHGVLSAQVVLPWEDEKEYNALKEALFDEHKPCGPTQEHLVEELAGVIWRKRRLWLVEQAAVHDTMEYAGEFGRSLMLQVFDPNKIHLVARYEAHLDRKFERVLRLFRLT